MTTQPVGNPHVPPMPERTPKALRAAISQHTPDLLPDFDAHWKKYIADAYDLAPVPAFMMRWWVEFAIARNPELDAHLHDLEIRASDATSNTEAQELLEEAARIRHALRDLEPGG